MENKEILLKALQKAINNGYKDEDDTYDCLCGIDEFMHMDRFIFYHEFAKTFWGEDEKEPKDSHSYEFRYKSICLNYGNYTLWQYHLQQMALWENPLHYLATFLKSDCCKADIIYTENSGVYIQPGHFCSKCKELL